MCSPTKARWRCRSRSRRRTPTPSTAATSPPRTTRAADWIAALVAQATHAWTQARLGQLRPLRRRARGRRVDRRHPPREPGRSLEVRPAVGDDAGDPDRSRHRGARHGRSISRHSRDRLPGARWRSRTTPCSGCPIRCAARAPHPHPPARGRRELRRPRPGRLGPRLRQARPDPAAAHRAGSHHPPGQGRRRLLRAGRRRRPRPAPDEIIEGLKPVSDADLPQLFGNFREVWHW